MPPKPEAGDKAVVLKGAAAEEAVRQYIKKCNRPYGAGALASRILAILSPFTCDVLATWRLRAGHADVSANIKKVGSKLATQKILLALTEKGEITQKSYGKQTFFVAKQVMHLDLQTGARCLHIGLLTFATLECKQSDEDDMPTEKADALQKEIFVVLSKHSFQGLWSPLSYNPDEIIASIYDTLLESTRIRLSPTTDSLPALISTLRSSLEGLDGVLAPYRISFADAPIPETKDVERLDADWARWREEWKKRKKIFKELRCFIRITPRAIWSSITEHLSPPDASELAESLGIEFDSEEHEALERGPLCQPPARHRAGTTGKTTKH
ncbi:hypothetical protein BS47DRAFT_1488977 [Hydnum rufescens UP504]|uniref:Homologous-pairing protein 2 winged helix domain-containing protein n=1 Tax=Hydnum rufescens UP504 TaxID=1448309 RepID=A0A9P6ALS3_9AGAM|nr:hypothetical protein BS47DRAFT_1488977 [Hydnum rufescens UP504]